MSKIAIPLSGGTYSVSGTIHCVYYTSESAYNASDVTGGYGHFYSNNGGNPIGGIITSVVYSRMRWTASGLIFKQSGSSVSMSSFVGATLTVSAGDTLPETIFNPPAAA